MSEIWFEVSKSPTVALLPVMVGAAALVLTVCFVAAVAAAAAGGGAMGPRAAATPIEHVVVLMLENRAFDHMLGHLTLTNKKVDGLTGKETNPIDPKDPSKGEVRVSLDQVSTLGYNPGHSVEETELELWGGRKEIVPNPMNGFVYEMELSEKLRPFARDIMRCYNSSTVPIISTLANSFAVFDKMYSSVPGDTGPNRMYSYSGTSHGAASNIAAKEVAGYPQRTIFDDLYESGADFMVYFSDFPISLEMKNLRDYPDHFKFLYDDFFDDVKAGSLPAYTWLEPRWFDFLTWYESDEHPHHVPGLLSGDVTYGELLIKDVYESLRNSSLWDKTLFIITYDEHGGTYDHVPPPYKDVPNPDGINSEDPPFKFDRLGLRVPFVAVSPWIDAGVVEGEPVGGGHYDHTSLLGTLRKLFPVLPQRPLTKREAWAKTYEHLLVQRKTPRTDCPTHLDVSPAARQKLERWEAAKQWKDNGDPAIIAEVARAVEQNPGLLVAPRSALMHDLQREAVRIASGLGDVAVNVSTIETQHDGAMFIRQQVRKWKGLS